MLSKIPLKNSFKNVWPSTTLEDIFFPSITLPGLKIAVAQKEKNWVVMDKLLASVLDSKWDLKTSTTSRIIPAKHFVEFKNIFQNIQKP